MTWSGTCGGPWPRRRATGCAWGPASTRAETCSLTISIGGSSPALVESLVCTGRLLLAANPGYTKLLRNLGNSPGLATERCTAPTR